MKEIEKTPSLMMFNAATRFRQGIALLSASTHDDNLRVHVYSEVGADDGMTYLKLDAEHGVSVTIDSTIKSKPLDNDVWVNLHDLCVMCDKAAKDGNATIWVYDKDLYIGACFNDGFDGFEVECCLHGIEPFTDEIEFHEDEKLDVEQGAIAAVVDTTYDFENMEIHRIDGVVSFRTGNDSIVIATITNKTSGESASCAVNSDNFAVRIPCDVFRVIPMIQSKASVTISFDFEHKAIQAVGEGFSIKHKYEDAKFVSEPATGMTDYMKFDTLAMATTIDTIYNINYKDTNASVKITPINESLASIEFGYENRYDITLTMANVHMYELDKPIVLPMNIMTMMIRNANCSPLMLKHSDDGKLFLCYQNNFLARKCMYFG